MDVFGKYKRDIPIYSTIYAEQEIVFWIGVVQFIIHFYVDRIDRITQKVRSNIEDEGRITAKVVTGIFAVYINF